MSATLNELYETHNQFKILVDIVCSKTKKSNKAIFNEIIDFLAENEIVEITLKNTVPYFTKFWKEYIDEKEFISCHNRNVITISRYLPKHGAYIGTTLGTEHYLFLR